MLRLSELGKHVLQLGDYVKEVNVTYREASPEFTNLKVKLGDGEKQDINSNNLFIKADMMNVGNDAGQLVAELKVNGQVVATQTYALDKIGRAHV